MLSGGHGTISAVFSRVFFVSPSVVLKASSGHISMNNHCVRRSSDNFNRPSFDDSLRPIMNIL